MLGSTTLQYIELINLAKQAILLNIYSFKVSAFDHTSIRRFVRPLNKTSNWIRRSAFSVISVFYANVSLKLWVFLLMVALASCNSLLPSNWPLHSTAEGGDRGKRVRLGLDIWTSGGIPRFRTVQALSLTRKFTLLYSLYYWALQFGTKISSCLIFKNKKRTSVVSFVLE